MAAGDRLIDDDGTFLVGSTGTALVKDGDDECPECCLCLECTGTTGFSLKVTLSGITACADCSNSDDFSDIVLNVNGVYNLDSSYEATISGAVTYTQHPNHDDCVDDINGTPHADDHLIELTLDCTGGCLYITQLMVSTGGSICFYSAVTSLVGAAIANTLNCDGTVNQDTVGSGGTALVEEQ